MSITVVNLQDDRAVFRIFIALLKFSFDPPSYFVSTSWTPINRKNLNMLPICARTLTKYKFYHSYCNITLMMVAKTTGICRRLLIYIKQHFTGVHFLVQEICKGKGKGKCTVKGKVHPRTGHEDPKGEKRYGSTLSLASVLDGVGGQRDDPASLHRYPLCRRLGGPQGRSGRVRKISPSTGIRFPDRLARSESLYRLSYGGPSVEKCK